MSGIEANSPAPGSRPHDWIGWSPAAWAGMILAAAVLIATVLVVHRGSWLVVSLVAFAVVTPVLAAIDLRWRVVPDRIVLPALVASLVLALATGFADGNPLRAVGSLAGGAALFGVYLVLALIAPRSMGMGDVKLAALIGAVVGSLAWPAWFVGLLAGFVAGAVIGLVVLASRRGGLRSHIPFAPAMLVGAWVAALAVPTGW